ncbi:MAG TPA: NAD(P)-dependent alcohol dehydrogenase [Prolixibacteraceae bacterium]|nr:NAD(P)-dependent alcohol dehydrogenase [Prolixibacteraceae bacterium]
MKAVTYSKFGAPEVLLLNEVEKPVPKDNEVLIKVHAASVNAYDWRHVRADPFLIRLMGGGLFRPKHTILGADIAGTVISAGKDIQKFKPGDEVFGEVGYGGFAEFVCCGENRIVKKPENISFEEATAAPMAALTALQGLRDSGNIQPGQNVLVNGASGGVGSFAVQIAKNFGARVTATCSSEKMEMVRSIGADVVFDYKKVNVTDLDEKFDFIFDVAAFRPANGYKKILKSSGRYAVAGGSIKRIFQLMFKSMLGNKNMKTVIAKVLIDDLEIIGDLLSSGKIKSVIDKTFPLAETSSAVRYVEEGRAKGKVVVVT